MKIKFIVGEFIDDYKKHKKVLNLFVKTNV